MPVIYDYYFSRYMDTLFLSKYRELKSKNRGFKSLMEWMEALLFGVVVIWPLKLYVFGLYVIPSPSMQATLIEGDYIYVDRLAYGPKMPVTPLSFPFVHHTLPFTDDTPSFVEWVESDYKRLWGYGEVELMDVVVFNFPAGDTVALDYPNQTYYDLTRMGYEFPEDRVIYRPVDKRENYVKRCVALAGDTMLFQNQELLINGQKIKQPDGVQYGYLVSRGEGVNPWPQTLTKADVRKLEYNGYTVEPMLGGWDSVAIFPHRPELYPWTKDNYGPVWVPKAGVTVPLSLETLPLYERIIKNYEGNELEVVEGVIYINGQAAAEYTFLLDYYFMMGDNRDNSLDSRFWGFVPVDHLEGKAVLIWMSIDPGKGLFGGGIRWDRVFSKIQ